METGGCPDFGVCAAVDVHYLSIGGARAAAVLAADAAFTHVLAERTAILARVPAYQPGEFYRRELPPLRAVLADLNGLGLLVVDGYADLDPAGRPGLGAHRRQPRASIAAAWLTAARSTAPRATRYHLRRLLAVVRPARGATRWHPAALRGLPGRSHIALQVHGTYSLLSTATSARQRNFHASAVPGTAAPRSARHHGPAGRALPGGSRA